MNWTLVADGVNNANPLFTNVLTALQQTSLGPGSTTCGRPMSRSSATTSSTSITTRVAVTSLSAMGVAVADSVAGPYTNKQIILRSGMSGLE